MGVLWTKNGERDLNLKHYYYCCMQEGGEERVKTGKKVR